MQNTHLTTVLILFATFLLLSPSTAGATEARRVEAQHARAERHLRAGLDVLARAESAQRPARKVRLADRALTDLRRAHAISKLHLGGKAPRLAAQAESALILALNVKTRVYLERESLERARRYNDAALSHARGDVEALKLRAAIARAAATDLFDEVSGSVGIQRVRERRESAGAPVRDRGLARRR